MNSNGNGLEFCISVYSLLSSLWESSEAKITLAAAADTSRAYTTFIILLRSRGNPSHGTHHTGQVIREAATPGDAVVVLVEAVVRRGGVKEASSSSLPL